MVEWVDGAIAHPRPASDEAVRSVVRALRVPFPDDFLAVARSRQGARPVPSGVTMPDGSRQAVDHLLHFEDEPFMSNFVARTSVLTGVLAKGELPFAEAVGGDVFLFDYRTVHELPPVAFWSADTGTVRLAATFTEFLTLLRD